MEKILISISNCRRRARTIEKEFSSVVPARVIIPPEQRVHSLPIIEWRNGERSDPGLIYIWTVILSAVARARKAGEDHWILKWSHLRGDADGIRFREAGEPRKEEDSALLLFQYTLHPPIFSVSLNTARLLL